MFLHNHLRFNILYNKDPLTELSRIVGFEVEPFSVKHTYESPWEEANPTLGTCNPNRATFVSHGQAPQGVEEGDELIFSYDVQFVVRGCCCCGLHDLAGCASRCCSQLQELTGGRVEPCAVLLQHSC